MHEAAGVCVCMGVWVRMPENVGRKGRERRRGIKASGETQAGDAQAMCIGVQTVMNTMSPQPDRAE